ncbi:hypothetical protein HK100_001264 [Physocladia obscura]|uniref:Uncharacterized protein n=1 Tax=Physocladia obscura TaxID=109957 RepID=A0AAD5SZZ9_9FUNG|nr:hypothetical protein HK100_001264 [Physocladia obscura]
MSRKLDDLLKDLGMSLDEFGGESDDASVSPPVRSATHRNTAYSLEDDMVEFLESFGDDDINGFGNPQTNIIPGADKNDHNAAIANPLNQPNGVLENTGDVVDACELAPALDDRLPEASNFFDSQVLAVEESTEKQQEQQQEDTNSAIELGALESNDDYLENINVIADERTIKVSETPDKTMQINAAETENTSSFESIAILETRVTENSQIFAIPGEVSKLQTEEIHATIEEAVVKAPEKFEDEIVGIISEDLLETKHIQPSQQQDILGSTDMVLDENVAVVETQVVVVESSIPLAKQTKALTITETIEVAKSVDATSLKEFNAEEEKHEVEELLATQIIALGSEFSDDSVIEVSKEEIAQVETTSDFVYEIIDSSNLIDEADTPIDVEVYKELQQKNAEVPQLTVSEKTESQQNTVETGFVHEEQPEPQESTAENFIVESQQHELLEGSQNTNTIEETKSQQETVGTDFEDYAIQETMTTVDEILGAQSESHESTPEFAVVGLQKNELIAEDIAQSNMLEVFVPDSQDAEKIIEVPATIDDLALIVEVSATTVAAATIPIGYSSGSEEASHPLVPSKISSPILQTVVIEPPNLSLADKSNETELITSTKSPSREHALSSTQSDVDLEYNNNHTPTSSGSELDNDMQVQIIRIKGQIERTRILINEQLRLRNMPPLMSGQLTLPVPAPVQMQGLQESVRSSKKRDSMISNVLQRVTSVTSPGPALTLSPAPSAAPTQAEEIRAMREKLEAARKEVAEKMAVNQALIATQQQQQQQRQQQTANNRSNSLKNLPMNPATASQPESITAHQNEPKSLANIENSEFPGVHKPIEVSKKKKSGGGETSSITSEKSGKSGKSTGGSGWFFGRKSLAKLKHTSEENSKSPAPAVQAAADSSAAATVAAAAAKKRKNINPDALINNPNMMMYGGGMGGGFRY